MVCYNATIIFNRSVQKRDVLPDVRHLVRAETELSFHRARALASEKFGKIITLNGRHGTVESEIIFGPT